LGAIVRKSLIFVGLTLAVFLGLCMFGPRFVLLFVEARNLPAAEVQIAPEKAISLKAGSSSQFYLVRLHGDSNLSFTCTQNGAVTHSKYGYFTKVPDQYIAEMKIEGCKVTRFANTTAITSALSLGLTPKANDLAKKGG
jgi:hypothetical protein